MSRPRREDQANQTTDGPTIRAKITPNLSLVLEEMRRRREQMINQNAGKIRIGITDGQLFREWLEGWAEANNFWPDSNPPWKPATSQPTPPVAAPAPVVEVQPIPMPQAVVAPVAPAVDASVATEDAQRAVMVKAKMKPEAIEAAIQKQRETLKPAPKPSKVKAPLAVEDLRARLIKATSEGVPNKDVASAVDVPPQQVSNWKKDVSIPEKRREDLDKFLRSRGY